MPWYLSYAFGGFLDWSWRIDSWLSRSPALSLNLDLVYIWEINNVEALKNNIANLLREFVYTYSHKWMNHSCSTLNYAYVTMSTIYSSSLEKIKLSVEFQYNYKLIFLFWIYFPSSVKDLFLFLVRKVYEPPV